MRFGGFGATDTVIADHWRLAIIKDLQYNSLKRQIVHIDFYGVTLKEKLTLEIDIELIGEPIGVEEGGILQV